MTPLLARQSVIIKCGMQKSVLTGNYEFYYAAGLLARLTGQDIADDVAPEALREKLDTVLPGLSLSGERERYLCRLLTDYQPALEYDAQMKELLLWGKNEEQLWSM